MRFFCLYFLSLLSGLLFFFASPAQLKDADWSSGNKRTLALQPLRELLSIPNDAKNGYDIRSNLAWLSRTFADAGFDTLSLPTQAEHFLLATRTIDSGLPTILFYMHFDGQPVHPPDWQQQNPYLPVLKEKVDSGWVALDWEEAGTRYDREWRIFARSASDDKGPIAMFLAAVSQLNTERKLPAFNIKVILDSEEEKGSPNLPELVNRYKDLLKADRMVILDGPRHHSNQPSLLFGCRGVAQADVTVFGPRGDLHSGHYGNYSPNPAFDLSSLLASMKDEQGTVLVPGFYQGVKVDRGTQKLINAVPDNKARINQQIGIAREVNIGQSYQEGLQFPSLNILNITSGQPEAGTRNIVPSVASASMDIRLVPGNDPTHLENTLRKFIAKKGYHFIAGEIPTEEERLRYPKLIHFRFTLSSMPFITEPTSPAGSWLSAITRSVFNQEPVILRMAGGTVPIASFIRALQIPAIIVPTVNPDNNQHAANENLKLGNYFEGISLVKAILLTKLR